MNIFSLFGPIPLKCLFCDYRSKNDSLRSSRKAKIELGDDMYWLKEATFAIPQKNVIHCSNDNGKTESRKKIFIFPKRQIKKIIYHFFGSTLSGLIR